MTKPTKPNPYDLWLTDEQGWKDHVMANCVDGYGMSATVFAWRWMILMQAALDADETVAECAERTSREADLPEDPLSGITAFQYGCAVRIIAYVWEHGEELRRWHNLQTQIGSEGEEANRSGGVLNPALITVDM